MADTDCLTSVKWRGGLFTPLWVKCENTLKFHTDTVLQITTAVLLYHHVVLKQC